MPDPRSQILLHQLGDLPAVARLPQLSSSAVGRLPFKTNLLRGRAVPYASDDALATRNPVLGQALLPRNASTNGSPMQVDTRRNSAVADGGVPADDLTERLRRVAAESQGSAEPMDTDAITSPTVAPGGETAHAPQAVVPAQPSTSDAMRDALDDVLRSRRKVMADSEPPSPMHTSGASTPATPPQPMMRSPPPAPPMPPTNTSRINKNLVKPKTNATPRHKH